MDGSVLYCESLEMQAFKGLLADLSRMFQYWERHTDTTICGSNLPNETQNVAKQKCLVFSCPLKLYPLNSRNSYSRLL